MGIIELTWVAFIIAGVIIWSAVHMFFIAFFDMRYSARTTIGVYILLVVTNLFPILINILVVNMLVSALTFAVIAHLYLGSIKTRIIYAVFIYVAAFVTDVMIGLPMAALADMQLAEIVFGTPQFIYALLTSRILLLIFVKIFTAFFGKRKLPKLNTIHWLALLVPSVGSTFVLYNFVFLRTHSLADFIAAMIVVVTNFIIIAVYGKILADYEADVKIKQVEEQVKYYSYQNYLAEESEKLIRKTKHDISNMLIAFQSDIQSQNIDNVQKSIAQLLGDIDSFDGPAKSGHLAIDLIINYKANIAKGRQVHISTELKIPKTLQLDSTVICQVLGNALDNAIEAAQKVDDVSERTIHIYMSYKQETLFLQMVNPYTGEIVTDSSERIMSSKRNFRAEGMGLQSIKGAVAGDAGAVGIAYENGSFCLSVIFYGIVESTPAP